MNNPIEENSAENDEADADAFATKGDLALMRVQRDSLAAINAELVDKLRTWLDAYDGHALQCHNANQFPVSEVDETRAVLASLERKP